MKITHSLIWQLSWMVALILVSGIVHTSAQESMEPPSYVVFQLDNDLFTGSDRDYTNGARIAWMGPVNEHALNSIQRILKRFSGAGRYPILGRLSGAIDDEKFLYEWGYGLTQLMFTPEDYTAQVAPEGQRPYAGWFGAEASLHAKGKNSVSSVVFVIGVTGRYSLAKETQEWVHKNISDSPIFQGWDSQIPAEITLNAFVSRKMRYAGLAEKTRQWNIQFDGFFEYGGAVGNGLTNAFFGSMFRAGYNLPDQFIQPRLEVGKYSHEPFTLKKDIRSSFSIYSYLGGRASAVLHNITLDGPVFKHYDSPVSSEAFVGQVVAGAGIRYKLLTVTMSKIFTSKEFDTRDSGHQFGSITVSLSY